MFRIGGNTFYNWKNKIPMKKPELKRSRIGLIAESRGIRADFPTKLKDINQDIMNTSSSLPKRCTIGPLVQFSSTVSSWTTNGKATTAGFLLVFEDNVGEDGLSSQSTYKVNIDCPYSKEASAPNPKVLNDSTPSKEQLEKVYGGIMKDVNELRLQIDSKKKPFLH